MIDEHAATAHYGDAAAELRAALETCALGDRADLMRLLGDGPDLLGLVQRLSTGDVAGLAPGGGKATILTTNKGRIVERLFVQHLGERGVALIGGAGPAGRVLDHLKRYTFAEKTGLVDVAGTTDLFTLSGPGVAAALEKAGLPRPEPLRSVAAESGGARLDVLGHDGVSAQGFAVFLDRARREDVWRELGRAVAAVGGRPCGLQALEAARVLRGLPAAGSELTEDHNPLEAGLIDAVAFDKGCYVGQEVVARLRTYDKVSRALWSLRLPAGSAAPPAGTALFQDGREVGRITTGLIPPGWSHPVALAYVKHKNAAADAPLRVGSADAPLEAIATDPPITQEKS